MFGKATWVSAVAVMLPCIACGGIAQENATVDFALRGLLAEREKIQSANFHISGTVQSSDTSHPENDLNGPIDVTGAFDRTRIRWDISEPGWRLDRNSLKVDPDNPKRRKGTSTRGVLQRKGFRTKDKSAYWLDGARYVTLAGPDANFAGDVMQFDVRAIGLYSWSELNRGTKLEDLVAGYLSDKSRKSVDQEPGGRLRLTLQPKQEDRNDAMWLLWLEPQQGFSPIRAEFRETVRKSDGKMRVTQVYETDWRQIDGIWLPVHHTMNARTTDGKLRRSMDLDIAWHGINAPLSPELFDYVAFGAPPELSVVDISPRTPVLIRSGEEEVVRPAIGIPTRFWLILLNAIILVLALYFVWRRRAVTHEAR